VRRLGATLPAGDPAQADLERLAGDLASQPLPFARTVDWAPFVLHGAPRIAG
jgi:hypothetical protein